MNLAVVQLIQKYPKLMELGDMYGLKANQLTPGHLQRVAAVFGATIPFTDELVVAFVDLLKGKDVNSVADAITNPDSIRDIVVFFTGGYQRLVEMRQSEAVEYSPDAEQLFIGA